MADYMYDVHTNLFYKYYGEKQFDVDNWSGAIKKCEEDGAELLISRNRKILDFVSFCES